MKVLLISWEYPPVIEGGLGRHVRKLSEHLVADGVEMHVLTRGGGHLPELEDRHGVTVHRVREPEFPKEIEAFVHWVDDMNGDMLGRGTELAARHRYDLIHSHDWLVAAAAEQLARSHSLPWLTTIHATEYGRHQGWVDKHPQSYIHGVERAMARRADRVITCSEYMRGHVSRVFAIPQSKVTAIPNGVDPAELDPVQPQNLDALRAKFAKDDELLVLLVGRLVYEKGFHLALDALAPHIRSRSHERKIKFVVAGTGTAEEELKKQAKRLRLGRAGTFLGWCGDDMLHALYRISDLCIVPSIYEPFGIVALEAMASGCLCIVADTGGLREVVPGDETVGLRFPAKDAEALGVLIERVLTDGVERERLIAEAREHVLRYDWSAVAQHTRTVYDALAPEPARQTFGIHRAPSSG
jgi:glycogen(starch) synthase